MYLLACDLLGHIFTNESNRSIQNPDLQKGETYMKRTNTRTYSAGHAASRTLNFVLAGSESCIASQY
jgi:hypothetical protein